MKKLLVYALAAFSIAGAGCSKELEGDDVTAGGKYTLPTIRRHSMTPKPVPVSALTAW